MQTPLETKSFIFLLILKSAVIDKVWLFMAKKHDKTLVNPWQIFSSSFFFVQRETSIESNKESFIAESLAGWQLTEGDFQRQTSDSQFVSAYLKRFRRTQKSPL